VASPGFVLHYAPRSRAFRILWLLEEVRAPYELVIYDLQKETHKGESYLAVNPDGKVPALVDRGPRGDWSAIITESAAISTYLVDACPEAGSRPRSRRPIVALTSRGSSIARLLEPAFADFMFPRRKAPAAGGARALSCLAQNA
jgi:glutathione S-transferase